MENNREITGTIVIPVYNESKLLNFTLEALAKCYKSEEVEIIIVDDGSDEVIQIEGNHKLNIRIFRNHKNMGRANARNVGALYSRGNILIFLDAGIIPMENFILAHLEANLLHENRVTIGYTNGFSDVSRKEREENFQDFMETVKSLSMAKDIRESMYDRYGEDLSKWEAPWIICWTNNLSVCRDNFWQINGFDEHFRTWGGEDNDLGIRLFLNGAKFQLEREARAVEFPQIKTNTFDNIELYELNFQKNRKYMEQKYSIRAIKLWEKVYYTELEAILRKEKFEKK